MTVNGEPIDDYTFRPAAASIAYTLEYEMEQARIYAGLPIAEWDALPGTPDWIDPERPSRTKSHMLILYRMNNAIPAAAQDAQIRKQERDANMHRRR